MILNKTIKANVILYKDKYNKIANINNYIEEENLSFDDISNIKLKIESNFSKSINSKEMLTTDREIINNSIYDEFIKNRCIVIDDKRRYIIKEIKETKYKQMKIKEIVAYSFEKVLENRYIEFEEIPYTLESITEMIYKVTGWNVEIDSNINTNNATYNIAGKYKVLTFIRDTLEDLYNIHADFNTIDNTITFNSIEKYNNFGGIYADWNNLINTVEEENESEIVTRLINTKEDCNIALEHITNTEYIEDFSYYINNNIISTSLISALNNYNNFLESHASEYKELKKELDDLENEKLSIENEIATNEELIKNKKEEKENTTDETTKDKLEKEIDNLENVKLVKLETNKTNIETEIENLEIKFKQLGDNVSKENSNCFSELDLQELQEIINEDEYNEEANNSEIQYKNMKDYISKLNKNKVTYNIDIPTLMKIIELIKLDRINLGYLFKFTKDIDIEDLRLISYRIDYINNLIDNLEFANSFNETDNKLDFFGNVVNETNKTKRKVEKVEVKVERVEEGLKTTVKKGELENIVTQNAESWNLSINGKLVGKTYKFDGNGFTLGSTDNGNTAIHTNEYSMWKHSNGDYSRADATGFYRNGSGVYHSLLEGGTAISGGSAGVFPKTVTIQLPDRFKGKNFKVIVNTVDTRGGEHLEYIKRIYLNVDSINSNEGTFTVTGYWTSILHDGDTVTENEKELQWSYIAIGG